MERYEVQQQQPTYIRSKRATGMEESRQQTHSDGFRTGEREDSVRGDRWTKRMVFVQSHIGLEGKGLADGAAEEGTTEPETMIVTSEG